MVWRGVATFGLLLTDLATRSPICVGLYITAAYWFTASTSVCQSRCDHSSRSFEYLAGIAPAGVLAFIAAQIIGALAAVALHAGCLMPSVGRNKDSAKALR